MNLSHGNHSQLHSTNLLQHNKPRCFCGSPNEDWRHFPTCNGTGAIIYRTGSWAELRCDLAKFPIHQEIWLSIELGLQHFARHPNKDDASRPGLPFGASIRANHILLNNAASSQTSIGWHNLLKCRISKEWSKLWAKAMGPQIATTCERAIIKALWNHTYRLWIFRNNDYHKNDDRVVAEYKQKELDSKIGHLYSAFTLNDLPLNPLQRSHFDIQQEQLLILSYDIRRAWLRSADLYLIRATAHDALARGSHAQFILCNTSGRHPGQLERQHMLPP
jgi:hypothetical protein